MTIGGNYKGYQLQYIEQSGFVGYGRFKKVNSQPSKYVCPSTGTTGTELDVTHVQNTYIVGPVQGSIVANNTILSYSSKSFYSGGNGTIDVYNYETGKNTKTSYNIKARGISNRYNAKPLFYNGTELFLLCNDVNCYDSYLYGYYSGEYYDLPQSVYQTLRFNYGSVVYCIIDNKAVLVYFKSDDDFYSYDLKTSEELNMNIKAKVGNKLESYMLSRFTFSNNKIVWVYSRDRMVYYDLVTQTVGA